MTNATKLETETCGRCGGSGRYSYNQIDGDRCYGCGGSGIRYTKRGRVAEAFLRALRKVPAGSIKVGDLVYHEPSPFASGGFSRVVSVGASTTAFYYAGGKADGERIPYFEITTERGGINTFADAMIRKGWSKEEKAAHLARALEFQATLTKEGKPRK